MPMPPPDAERFGPPDSNPVVESFIHSHLSSTSNHSSNGIRPQAVWTTSSMPLISSPVSFLQPGSSLSSSTGVSSTSSRQSSSSLQPIATTTNPSSPQHTQSMPASTGDTRKLIIGHVVAVVIVILLAMIGLAHSYIRRKRRRRQNDVAKAHHHDVKQISDGEDGTPQPGFQWKAELDVEQRRHEMEAGELRFELQGTEERHEMAGGTGDGYWGRQELKGDDLTTELEDNTTS